MDKNETIHKNAKWIKYLNVRPKTIKLLEENIGSNYLNIGFGDGFFGLDTTNKGNKSKINKWVYIKLKSSTQPRNDQQKQNRQPIKWEKIFTNDVFNK